MASTLKKVHLGKAPRSQCRASKSGRGGGCAPFSPAASLVQRRRLVPLHLSCVFLAEAVAGAMIWLGFAMFLMRSSERRLLLLGVRFSPAVMGQCTAEPGAPQTLACFRCCGLQSPSRVRSLRVIIDSGLAIVRSTSSYEAKDEISPHSSAVWAAGPYAGAASSHI